MCFSGVGDPTLTALQRSNDERHPSAPQSPRRDREDSLPGLVEVLREGGIDAVRYALRDATGWHRDYGPPARRNPHDHDLPGGPEHAYGLRNVSGLPRASKATSPPSLSVSSITLSTASSSDPFTVCLW